MRLALALGVAAILSCPARTAAQESAVQFPIDVGTTEWMITAGPAFGFKVFKSSDDYRYLLQTVSWGRVLSGEHGGGRLRGRFQWSFEVVPFYGQYGPHNTIGVGVTPLLWRWNFVPHGKVAPFAELAGGALFTRDPVPAQTTRGNFTAHASYGLRYLFRPHTALIVSYRFHHISNGNRRDDNPGVNAHVLQFGLSFLRPR